MKEDKKEKMRNQIKSQSQIKSFPKDSKDESSLFAGCYGTSNLYEASYILTKNFVLRGKVSNGGKITIFFEGGEEARKAGLEFYNNAPVEAKGFANAYRSIKDFVFEGGR